MCWILYYTIKIHLKLFYKNYYIINCKKKKSSDIWRKKINKFAKLFIDYLMQEIYKEDANWSKMFTLCKIKIH